MRLIQSFSHGKIVLILCLEISSSKAEAVKTVHRPVWKDETLLSKNSWSGSLECMQYFATVAPNSNNILRKEEEILWLTRETIEDTRYIMELGSYHEELKIHISYFAAASAADCRLTSCLVETLARPWAA